MTMVWQTILFVICVPCTTAQTLTTGSQREELQTTVFPNIGTTDVDVSQEGTDDQSSEERTDSSDSETRPLSPEISDLLGKTMSFSKMVAFTEGVQLTLGTKPIDLNAFTVDESNAELLNEMLRGRNITELFYVASKIAGMEAKTAALANEPITTLALEDIFDPNDDILKTAEYVDELEREITEDPSILDLEHTSESYSHDRTKRKATSYASQWWSTIIPYKISSDFANQQSKVKAIRQGIQHWEEETCLTFKEIRNDMTYPDSHIIFRDLVTCHSDSIGKSRRKGQIISIGRGCGTIGIVAHEIGHALGFYHEQSRPDRDSYVRVHTDRIEPARKNNFYKRTWRDVTTKEIPYDYSSIMHYDLRDFSTNGLNTLDVLEDGMESVVGSRSHLSFFDVKLANFIYCPDRCSQGLAWSACQNEGYRDPKDCSRCKCPDGWSGRFCDEVKAGVNASCGYSDLTASSSWQSLKSPNYDGSSLPRNSECTWRIKTSLVNHRIVARFVGTFAIPSCFASCRDYIEIRTKDMAKVGPRYCCYTKPTDEIFSHGKQMLLLMRTPSGSTRKGFHLEYKVEPCGCSADSSSAPACLETRSYQCRGSYKDYSTGRPIIKFRNNTCYEEISTCCNGFQRHENTCYRASSSPWSFWSAWTSCSRTCGSGSRRRNRVCLRAPCSGPTTDTQICNGIACPASWSNWYSWSSCSQTCGSGYKQRRRTCSGSSCSGSSSQTTHCYKNACTDQWTLWYAWSRCSTTCGSGLRSRRRTCLVSPCSGPTTDTQTCNGIACPASWSNWYSWSSCSQTCGSGYKQRRRTCSGSLCSGSSSQTTQCLKNACTDQWSVWYAWSSCSTTCGSGLRSRTRACLVSPCSGSTTETQVCSANSCSSAWSDWSGWSTCSKTCNFGTQNRIRTCIQQPCSGSTTISKYCYITTCPGQWSSWDAWSSCSETCGSGRRTKSRICLKPPCSGSITASVVCNNTRSCPGQWSSWYAWSGCSKTCGSGTQTRNRECLTPPCSGSTIDRKTCNSNACSGQWSNWYAWSTCSKTCGSGYRIRYRQCLGSTCSGLTSERQTCNSQECVGQWSNWYGWSSCSKTCGSGYKIRRRTCSGSNCSGSPSERRDCNTQECVGHWSNWNAWTTCSKTCGIGYTLRSRDCIGYPCYGNAFQGSNCNNVKCPESDLWSSWSVWSSCSKSCGSGTQSRSRTCRSSSCSGLTSDTKSCNTQACTNSRRCSYTGRCDWLGQVRYCTRYRAC